MSFDLTPYRNMAPKEMRLRIRRNEFNLPTSGMCLGYAQANLVVMPRKYAGDFLEYAQKNPLACPVLEVIRETPETKGIAEDGNIATDISEYYIYRNGKRVHTENDITSYWEKDFVGFLIGCSLLFLTRA